MDTIDSAWNRSLLRPLLIASMVAALLMGPLAVGRVLAPEWDSRWAVPVSFLVALEAVYTTTWLAHPARRQRRSAWFRVAELIAWCVAIRVLLWLLRAHWPDLAEVGRWITAPGSFFDAEFIVGCLLAALSWVVAGSFGADLQRLALQPDELTDPPPGWDAHEWRAPLSYETSRGDIMSGFARRWMAGGTLLVLCAAATQVRYQPGAGLRSFGVLHVGLQPRIVAGLVIYFLGGLVLLSLGRLAMLRAVWCIERVAAEPAITRRWPRLALLLLLLTGTLAALMPLGSTWRLGGWLRAAVGFSVRAAVVVAGYFVALLTTLLRWLTQALGWDTAQPNQPVPAPEVPSLPPEPASASAVQLPGWLGSLAFWLPLIFIVAYALVTFLRQRGVHLDRRHLARLWLGLLERWRRWRRSLRAAARTLRLAVAERWARQTTKARQGRRSTGLVPWRALSPRQRVLTLYLFTLARAAALGVRRSSHQTPYEFEPVLGQSWPEADEDMQALTLAFVEARYGGQPISTEQVVAARQAWRNVRTALRLRRQPQAVEAPPREVAGA
jgi:hypothetical protein